MNHQEFFKRFEDYSIETGLYENNLGLNFETLYQAFKARIMDEVAMSLHDEGLIETPNYIYLENESVIKKGR